MISKTVQNKIVSLDELAAKVAELKKRGKKVVHCHGVFDLLHVGHIRHFNEAKAFGDVLVVTLTQDAHVNKGPGRPAFTDVLRAEAIASLGEVDFVAINRWPSGVEAIKLVKPTYYVKGPDYKDASKDVTGGIKKEEEAIHSVGGEIKYTEDITFSSSSLINQHLPYLSDESKEYFDKLRKKNSAADVKKSIESLSGLKVLVVGETILDEYIYCSAMGKSSKEPILAMQQLHGEMFSGGALAIANHIADFCDSVDVVTNLGDRNTHEDLVRKSLKSNVNPSFIYKKDSPTLIKRRYVENYLLTKMFEIYEMNDEPLSGKNEDDFCAILEKKLKKADVVVVADYGHGLMTAKSIELVSKKAKFLAVNTQINAANIGFHTIAKYPKADYICIHEGEIRLEHRSRTKPLEPMIEKLFKDKKCKCIMVTRGKVGTMIYNKKEGYLKAPSFAIKVVDRVGAGDAVLSITSLCAAKNISGDIMGFVGNLAGAQAVMIVGNRSSIEKVRLLKSVEAILK